MTNPMQRILLVSVGGSAAPILHSINEQKPDYVIYFCSADSRKIVRQEIEPALQFRLLDYETITTPDEQNLVESVSVLLTKLPDILKLWNLGFDSLGGDYTGGTKTMSSALVLVLAKYGCRFSYVGGTVRDKEGLGVVLNGREQMLYLQNPWDVLAVDDLREIRALFNRCRFRTVSLLAQRAAERTDLYETFFKALRNIADGFSYWDTFQYRQALTPLRQGLGLLKPFSDGQSCQELQEFSRQVSESLVRLGAILNDAVLFKSNPSAKDIKAGRTADGMVIIVDLLANAMRRAEIEFKYDDAVARLYSAIEKMAKVRLKVVYGLDNSNLDLALIPESLHQELCDHYQKENGRIQIPLGRSYTLLQSLGDPLGDAYFKYSHELEKILNIRNMSLLAHGFEPVTAETYKKMLDIALAFVVLTEKDLPRFPTLDWQGLIQV